MENMAAIFYRNNMEQNMAKFYRHVERKLFLKANFIVISLLSER